MATDFTNYPGLFFRKYGKKVIDSFGPNDVIQSKVPIGEAEKVGESYIVPITLADEQGATYAKNSSGAFALEAAVDGELKTMTVVGANHVFRSNIGYEAAAASLASDVSADNTSGRVAKSLRRNARKRIECDFLYGQSGLGVVEATNPAGSPAGTIQIKPGEWAPAIWVGMKNAKLEVFSSNLSAQRTGTAIITKVRTSNRWVTVDAIPTSTVADDIIFFKGQFVLSGAVHHSCIGLHTQLGNTATSLFGLDPTTYEVIAGNVINGLAARLSFDKVQEAASACQDMGSEAESMQVLVSPLTWGRLNSDLAADRRFDGSYTKAKGELGNRSIVYHSAIGDLEIMAHPLVKRGYAYGFSWDDLKRPGSYDLSFTRPVGNADRLNFEGAMLTELPDNAGFQVRLFHSSAILHVVPSHGFLINNIDNT